MRILLDTNVIIDVLLARDPFVNEAKVIWQAHAAGRIQAGLTASSLTDIFYILNKIDGADEALRKVVICLETFEFCTVDSDVLKAAAKLAGSDFEDNLQIACAIRDNYEAIVTRDTRGFIGSSITTISPIELIKKLQTAN